MDAERHHEFCSWLDNYVGRSIGYDPRNTLDSVIWAQLARDAVDSKLIQMAIDEAFN